MNKSYAWVGVLVTVAILLFGTGLFLIGNQHKAFRSHITFYTEFANVDGIFKGAKVRVDGLDAGQVDELTIPSSPAHKFRVKLIVEDRTRGLIRDNSVVSVETEGLVGDKYLLIGHGTEQSPEATPETTLVSKEPFDIGKMLEQANGLLTQVGGTITDVQGKLDTTLAAVTTTVNNTNGVVTDIRHGKGAAGMLLEDPKTEADVRQILGNTQQATSNLNTAAVKVNGTVDNVNGMLEDVNRRQLVAKVDDTLNSAKSTVNQLDQVSQRVNTTLNTAFAEDQYGQDAGANLQQSLSNINNATGNLADDTAALKNEFFFKGFFKKRGYDSLDQLPIESYRSGKLIRKPAQNRQWLPATALFQEGPSGTETLTAEGRAQIDQAVSQIPDLYGGAIIVEGYSTAGDAGKDLARSRQRAQVVRAYLQLHYHLAPKNTGIIGLSTTPPAAAGKPTWDGVCLVRLAGV
jgi:phospholipid/cholesterol/gamma-HCH transport system substrate-binding protein